MHVTQFCICQICRGSFRNGEVTSFHLIQVGLESRFFFVTLLLTFPVDFIFNVLIIVHIAQFRICQICRGGFRNGEVTSFHLIQVGLECCFTIHFIPNGIDVETAVSGGVRQERRDIMIIPALLHCIEAGLFFFAIHFIPRSVDVKHRRHGCRKITGNRMIIPIFVQKTDFILMFFQVLTFIFPNGRSDLTLLRFGQCLFQRRIFGFHIFECLGWRCFDRGLIQLSAQRIVSFRPNIAFRFRAFPKSRVFFDQFFQRLTAGRCRNGFKQLVAQFFILV